MTTVLQPVINLDQLNQLTAEELLAWAYESHGDRAAIITSFQDTGCVLIDMAHRVAPGLRVLTIDTLRLPEQTYALMERIEDRYGIEIERFQPDPERLRRMVEDHGEYLFFDTKAKQELCCQVRKVEPNNRAVETVDVWFTGLRRDQSDGRKDTPKAAFTSRDGRRLLKLSALVDWSTEDVQRYCRENGVPLNPLYGCGYTSIGCTICTTPTRSGEDRRAGRWRWFNQLGHEHKKECGIHSQGEGI